MKNTSKILALVLVVMTVLMSLSAITASAAEETKEFVFDASTLTAAADKEVIEGDTAYDEFFTFVGTGTTKRWSSSKGVYAAEINKKSQSGIQFTIPEGAINAKAVVSYASTGGSNTSLLNIIDSTGAALGANKEVTGTTAIDAEFALSAGTYQVVAPSSDRGTRISKIVVTYSVETCDHEGGEATCAQQAICSKCGQPYGDLTDDHNFVDGKCTVCELPDPSICNHANMAPATCLLPATCECGYTEGEALGHDIVVDPAVEPDCVNTGLEAGEHCSRCDYKVEQKEVAALGHTLTFVNTVPTLEAAGGVKAHCSVCNEDIDYGTFNVMTPGTYVLDAKELADISASGQAYDGQVRIVGGVFACHLSGKYRTDANVKTFAADDWTSTHRMNFGSASNFCNIGEGEEAVRNGGLRNFIQIVTTEETTITFHWVIGGDGRELGVYDMAGELVAITEEKGLKNDVVVSTVTVPAGAYIIGSASSGGGSYIFKVTVDVAAPHTHVWSDATCTEPAKCECGETQGEALGHTWVDATCEAPKSCSVCGATEGEALGHTYVDGKCACGAEDPDYVAPQPPVDEPIEEPKDEVKEEEKELNFFEKILAWFMDLINKFLALFK